MKKNKKKKIVTIEMSWGKLMHWISCVFESRDDAKKEQRRCGLK